MTAADVAAHQTRVKGATPRTGAAQPKKTLYDLVQLPTAEPPGRVELVRLPLLPLPRERSRRSWTATKKARFRRSLARQIAVQLGGAWRYRPYRFAHVNVYRHSAGEVDDDNLVASVKELLDVLQPLSARCPDGLGVILGDDPKHIDRRCSQCTAARGDGHTTVEIYGI